MEKTRIVAPRTPEPTPPFRFPVLATIAPMVAAVVMWLVTGSPFALMFAALGPVTALASLADSRIGSRRTRRRELHRFQLDTVGTRGQIESEHSLERLGALELTPFARTIIARTGADPYRWRASCADPVLACVGTGPVRSSVEVERSARQSADSAAVAAALDELVAAAAILDFAPVCVDARLGIGVCGPQPFAAAAARAIALQLAWALSPAEHWLAGAEGQWMSLLPHRAGPGPAPSRPGIFAEFGEHGQPGPTVTLAVAASGADLPGACAIVLRVGGEEGAAIVRHPDRALRRPVRVEAVSLDEAAGWAQFATIEAEREGIVSAESGLPGSVLLGPLLEERGKRAESGEHGGSGPYGSSLACAIAIDTYGPVVIDLVAHGPHAVIGGTTGSGKSELLVSWIVAMAVAHSPEVVNFLLVDFKGGSAFAPLTVLPHTAGIITDLDDQQAARALASLRAELRFRERWLADAGARSIDEATGLPRLVIVVDEFAAMLVDYPDLHALFADIAARGRSLGVHLVLCTQRPAGAVRDGVLANADLRVSLRVNNRADSSAVVGTDAAATIPASARGRGILSLGDGPARLVQFAIASPADVHSAASRWPGAGPIRRPWREPLPLTVPLAALGRPEEGFAFGLVDLPDEQRIATASWMPQRDGHLLVLGVQGSGKSTALETFATAGAVTWLPAAADAAWDVLSDLDGARQRLVLIDDLDSVLASFPPDHRAVFVERLAALLRDGPTRGIRVILAAQRLTSQAQGLAGLASARLMLAHASRQDFVLAGADGAHYVDGMPPGGGSWRNHRVQVAIGAAVRPADDPARVEPAGHRAVAIVSVRARSLASRLVRVVELATAGPDVAALVTGPGGPIVLGDVDEWQSRWGALAALRPVADILFDGCSVADYRALTRSRELPPPILEPDVAWRLEPDGSAVRVRLPVVAV